MPDGEPQDLSENLYPNLDPEIGYGLNEEDIPKLIEDQSTDQPTWNFSEK